MYRSIIRNFKFAIDSKTSGIKNYSQYNDIRRYIHIKYSIIRGRAFTRSTDVSGFISPTKSCYYIDNKYLSQQNVKLENDKSKKSEEPSSSIPSSKLMPSASIQEDQSISNNKEENQLDLIDNINLYEITEGDEEKVDQFKLLILEIDVMRQDGMKVPSKMSTEQWKELFALRTRSQRLKYLTFLFIKEMKKLSDKRKKELKRLAFQDQVTVEKNDENGDIKYGFRGSTIFLRIYDNAINFHDNYRLIRAMMFGQNLVVDCGFYNDMNTMENKLCCKQLIYLFAENRLGKEPFNLHFVNLNKDSILYKEMNKCIPTLEDPTFPINVYEESYLDMFPKEKLVYLTPHCRTELKEFSHDDIYIIGAIVDKVNQQPLTLAKAKSEGLRMAHLPLDRYLSWVLGTKSLTLNQVVNILHDVQVTGDWNIALKHVPQRKIRQSDEPLTDNRKPWRRGTVLQPPKRFIKRY